MACNVNFRAPNSRMMSNAAILVSQKIFGKSEVIRQPKDSMKRIIVGDKHRCQLCNAPLRLAKGKFVKLQARFNSDGTVRKYQHEKGCKQESLF